MRGKQNFCTVVGQTFYVVGGGGYDDVDEEMYVSEANFLVSKASKLSAGATIFKGQLGPQLLVLYILHFKYIPTL